MGQVREGESEGRAREWRRGISVNNLQILNLVVVKIILFFYNLELCAYFETVS